MRARAAARRVQLPTERPAGLSRPCGRESLTRSFPGHCAALWGIMGAEAPPINPAAARPLPHHPRPPAVHLPHVARFAGGGAGLRETLKVPAPGTPRRRPRRAGDGSCATHNVTGCARRDGFRHPVRRPSPAPRRCTRATSPGGYARLGSLSPALASSLRRVGRLRRAFVGGRAPHTPTVSRGRCDRCRGAAPARSGGVPRALRRTALHGCRVRSAKGRAVVRPVHAWSVAP